MTNYLLKKRQRWYATLDVPKDVRGIINKTKFMKSLQTDDRRRALALCGPIIAAWKQQIENARGSDEIVAEASIWRSMLHDAKSAQEKAFIEERIVDRSYSIEELGFPKGVNDLDTARKLGSKTEDAERFHSIATGETIPLTHYMETWLSDTRVGEKTKDEYRAAFKDLAAEFQTVEEVSRRKASEFVRNKLSPGRAQDTVQKKLSAYSGHWKWLELNGYIPDDRRSPWDGLKPRKANEEALGRRAFTEPEASAVLAKALERHSKFPDDFHVVQLLAVTGLRLEEAARLRIRDCSDQGHAVWLHIREAKTKAGIRRVPVVCKTVMDMLRVRLEDREDEEYVFGNLVSKVYNKRSHTLSQRLGRSLRLVVKDESVVASHSWRHRARTLLEQGDINPWVSDWIMGHSRPGEGLNRYSKGPSDEQLLAAMKWVVLP